MERERAMELFVKLEQMTCTMEGDPKAEDPADRDDVIEPMFDVRLDAVTDTPGFEAVRGWRLRVKWSKARGLDFLGLSGNDRLREVIDLATEVGGGIRIENSALEIA